MKSLKYLAIALAVASVAVTATPADAGSVGVNGGKTQKVTRVDNVYNDYKHQDKVTQKREDKQAKNIEKTATGKTTYTADDVSHQKGNTKYQVNVRYTITGGNYGYDGMANSYGWTGKYDSLDQARGAAKDMAVGMVAAKRDGVTKYSVRGMYYSGSDTIRTGSATFGWVRNSGCGGGSTVKDGGEYLASSYETSKTSKRREKTDSKTVLTGERDVETSTDTKKTGETWAFKGQTYKFSDDAIIVGDTDGGNVYAAQGSMTIENHYDRTDHYLVTHNIDHIKTYTTTDTYTTYTDTQKTRHKVYKQDYVYQARLGVEITPIVLDLDGDGKIEASNGQYLPHSYSDFAENGNVVMFDFYGNGFPVVMEWVGVNDGLLCRPEADGTVKGTNLFGSANGYDNGYDELSSIDTNRDGKLTGEELNGLMIWQDANKNGVADKGELKSLESLGITSISTTHNNYSSSYTRNGKNYKTFDWHPNTLQTSKVNVAH